MKGKLGLTVLLAVVLTALGSVTVSAPIAFGGHVRPQGASPIRDALVPAFKPCTAPNRLHGPPDLPGGSNPDGSCYPPVQTSDHLWVGTGDVNGAGNDFSGYIRLTVRAGVPGPPDDSDILVEFASFDIRCRAGASPCGAANVADGPDYVGQVLVSLDLRISDHWNWITAGGGAEAATVNDTVLPIPVQCSETTSADGIGSRCLLNTSFNAVVPGMVKDGKRAVIEKAETKVFDGGSDGDVATDPTSNQLYLREGLFVP